MCIHRGEITLWIAISSYLWLCYILYGSCWPPNTVTFSFLPSTIKIKSLSSPSRIPELMCYIKVAGPHRAGPPFGICSLPDTVGFAPDRLMGRTSLQARHGIFSKAKSSWKCPDSWGNAFSHKSLNLSVFHLGWLSFWRCQLTPA